MFCPNCGKDCGEFNFCPECGKALQVKEESTEEKRARLKAEGILFCPECLSTSVALKENNHTRQEYRQYRYPIFKLSAIILEQIRKRRDRIYGHIGECNNCGFRWYPKLFDLYERYLACAQVLWIEDKNTYGMVYCVNQDTKLKLDGECISITRNTRKPSIIEYHKLARVEHRKPLGASYGRLSFRSTAQKQKPFPKSYEAAKRDKYTILYDAHLVEKMDRVYTVLHNIIEESKKSKIV